jgi:hypothetical protein
MLGAPPTLPATNGTSSIGSVSAACSCEPRANTTEPNQFAGYAVALPDDHNAAGDTIWYSGSTLADGLSLPRLRRPWPSP